MSAEKALKICEEIDEKLLELVDLLQSSHTREDADEVFEVIRKKLGHKIASDVWDEIDWNVVRW